ncbi:Scr1 family TA system antitoxin-like transcriptional regulator [Amycolatopsis sp. NPDC047767]|uniref:helix-turn-helix domain-containing protein n=1 Tax=Amycolatopsis sp. NPDC047767 TaxID=3156765 RepID=UPI003453FF49
MHTPNYQAPLPAAIVIGAELRAARLAARWGIRELARKAGLSPSLLCHWELGSRIPTPDTASYVFGLLRLPQGEASRLRSLAVHAHDTVYAEHRPTWSAHIERVYERASSAVQGWSPSFVPLSLQEPSYTWDMLEYTTAPDNSPEARLFDLTAEPDVRQRDLPPEPEWLIGRRALCHPAIRRESSIAQHHRLLSYLTKPSSNLRIVDDAEDLEGFTMYRQKKQLPTVALRHSGTTIFLVTEDAATVYNARFEHLAQRALSRAETCELITKQLRELETSP